MEINLNCNHMKLFKLMAIGSLLFMLLGCREYMHYSFKHVEIDLWNGRLQIGIEGSYRDYEEDGKRHQIKGNPYVLTFRFFYPNTENIDKIEVSEATLIGLQDGVSIPLGKGESSDKYDYEKWSDKNDKRILMAVGINALRKVELSYQAYDVSCLVEIYRDSELIESKRVKIRLETDFMKGKRSDVYDYIMGV